MQTRADLEFMADMLGVPGQQVLPPFQRKDGYRERLRYEHLPTEHLEKLVVRGKTDGVSVARAQHRLGNMLATLERIIESGGHVPEFQN